MFRTLNFKKVIYLFVIAAMLIFPSEKAVQAEDGGYYAAPLDFAGNTEILEHGLRRDFDLKISGSGRYDITIKPLSGNASNYNGSVRIPVENIYIDSGETDVMLVYGLESVLLEGAQGGSVNRITAKVKDFNGMVPAGIYELPVKILQISSSSGKTVSERTLNLIFDVPIYQRLRFKDYTPKITNSSENAKTEVRRVYVTSNTDWELAVKADLKGQRNETAFIKTSGASMGVNARVNQRIQMEPGREIIIARGRAGALNDFVSIEYTAEGADNSIYTNDLEFILRRITGR